MWRKKKQEVKQLSLDQLKKIGFASNFERIGRALHIQTEVITSRKMKIKTTVLDHGIVLDAVTTLLNDSLTCDLEKLEKTAKAQHEDAVNALTSGRYDKLIRS